MGAAFGIHLGAGREQRRVHLDVLFAQLPLVLAFGVRGQDEQVVIDLKADLERQQEGLRFPLGVVWAWAWPSG